MEYKKIFMTISFEIDKNVPIEDIIFQDDDVIDAFQITRNTEEDLSCIFRMKNPIVHEINESEILK